MEMFWKERVKKVVNLDDFFVQIFTIFHDLDIIPGSLAKQICTQCLKRRLARKIKCLTLIFFCPDFGPILDPKLT